MDAKTIKKSVDLKQAIKDLEAKVKDQEEDLKLNYLALKDNLHPNRVAKNTFQYLAETPEIQRSIVNTMFGFLLGYASKRAVALFTEQNLDRAVQALVTDQINKLEYSDPESLLSKGIGLFRKYTPPDSPIYPFVKY